MRQASSDIDQMCEHQSSREKKTTDGERAAVATRKSRTLRQRQSIIIIFILCKKKMNETVSVPPKIDEIFTRIKKLVPTDKVRQGLDVKLRDGDILLAVGSKSGTTWVQQVESPDFSR